jgi:hypothetical protein
MHRQGPDAAAVLNDSTWADTYGVAAPQGEHRPQPSTDHLHTGVGLTGSRRVGGANHQLNSSVLSHGEQGAGQQLVADIPGA